MHLQASRDEGFDVDEGLAEQDATSLIEVRHLFTHDVRRCLSLISLISSV